MTKVYAGTYTSGKSEGIYTFELTEGKLSPARLFCPISNPKYLCRYKDRIVAIADFDDGSGCALIDRNGIIVDQIVFEEKTSCYVTVKGDRVFTANYHEGTISSLKIIDDRFVMEKTLRIRDKAGCHQVLFHDGLIYVPVLFLDEVQIFDEDLNKIGVIELPVNSGPRHGVFSEDGRYLYILSELSVEIFAIDLSEGCVKNKIALTERDQAAAALRMRGDHLYASVRFRDLLSVVAFRDEELILKQQVSCGGSHPRDFIITGDHLLCANRFSDDVVSFELSEDGTIKREISRTRVPEVICLLV